MLGIAIIVIIIISSIGTVLVIPETSEPIKKAIIEGTGGNFNPERSDEPLLDQFFPKIDENENIGPQVEDMAKDTFKEGIHAIDELADNADIESLNLPNEPTNEELEKTVDSGLEVITNLFRTGKSTHKLTENVVELSLPGDINPNLLWGIALLGAGIIFWRFGQAMKKHLKFLIPFIIFVLIALIMLGVNIA